MFSAVIFSIFGHKNPGSGSGSVFSLNYDGSGSVSNEYGSGTLVQVICGSLRYFFDCLCHKGRVVQVTKEAFSSLKKDHPALQNMKFLKNFILLWVISPSWIRIRIPNTDPDLDPLTRLNPDPIGIRIRIRNPGWYTHMCEAGRLHAGDNDRRIAADTEAVPLVVFLPANQKMSSLNI